MNKHITSNSDYESIITAYNNYNQSKNYVESHMALINQSKSNKNNINVSLNKTNLTHKSSSEALNLVKLKLNEKSSSILSGKQLTNFLNAQSLKLKNNQQMEVDDSSFSSIKNLFNFNISNNPKIAFSQQILDFRVKLKQAVQVLKVKQENDMNEIMDLIYNKNEQELYTKLTDEKFMFFYQRVFKSNKILNLMYKSGLGNLVRTLIDHDRNYYSFDNSLIISILDDSINSLIKNESFNVNISILELNISQAIKYDLYDQSKSYLFAYYIGIFKIYDSFKSLYEKEKDCFSEDLEIFNNFVDAYQMNKFIDNTLIFNTVIGFCILNNLEDKALSLLKYKGYIHVSNEILVFAISNYKLNIVKLLWDREIERQSKCTDFNSNESILSICFIFNELKKIHADKKYFIDLIINWNNIYHDKNLIDWLFNHKYYNEILYIVIKGIYKNWNFKKEYLQQVIEDGYYELIVFFLKEYPSYATIFSNHDIQNVIVHKFIKKGEMFYYASEMLSRIYKYHWDSTLTKDLCKNLNILLQSREILNCHSPIISCLLICEFLKQLSNTSMEKFRIKKVINQLIQFCLNIQNLSKDDKYLEFLMYQNSIKGLNSLQIASKNNFYKLFEHQSVGLLILKFWKGEISYLSPNKSSSIAIFASKHIGRSNIINHLDSIKDNRYYYFSVEVWKNNCSIRYFLESLFTVLLIITYYAFIYLVKNKDPELEYDDVWYEKLVNDPFIDFTYYFYVFQVVALNLGFIFQLIIHYLNNSMNKLVLKVWDYYNFTLMLVCISLQVNWEQILIDNFGESIERFGHFTNITNWSISYFLVFGRIAGLLLGTEGMGSAIKIIFLMFVMLLKYLFIYLLVIICSASVFVSIFFFSYLYFS